LISNSSAEKVNTKVRKKKRLSLKKKRTEDDDIIDVFDVRNISRNEEFHTALQDVETEFMEPLKVKTPTLRSGVTGSANSPATSKQKPKVSKTPSKEDGRLSGLREVSAASFFASAREPTKNKAPELATIVNGGAITVRYCFVFFPRFPC
jgi:hypothetical protein